MTMTELERLVGALTYERNNQCFHLPCSDLECQDNNASRLMPLTMCQLFQGGGGGTAGYADLLFNSGSSITSFKRERERRKELKMWSALFYFFR